MKKGEESRQRLICCAAELFWKNGYSATGINEILTQTGLPKGSFYFYFKSKDELAVEVITYYQSIILEHFQVLSVEKDWKAFVNAAFDYLLNRTENQAFSGCPLAVMGMETAFYKPEIAARYMDALKQFQKLFYDVLLQSGLPGNHAEILSQRFLAVYQGEILLGRISSDISYLETARKNLVEMYEEYRTFYKI